MKLTRFTVVFLALIALTVVVGALTESTVVWVLLVVMVTVFGCAGMSSGSWGRANAVARKDEIARLGFPARKRFEDAPAAYDESAWEREKARREADGRSG